MTFKLRAEAMRPHTRGNWGKRGPGGGIACAKAQWQGMSLACSGYRTHVSGTYDQSCPHLGLAPGGPWGAPDPRPKGVHRCHTWVICGSGEGKLTPADAPTDFAAPRPIPVVGERAAPGPAEVDAHHSRSAWMVPMARGPPISRDPSPTQTRSLQVKGGHCLM